MAELAGLPTPRMDWSSSDAPQALTKFKNLCELYFTGPLKEKSEEEQVSYLLIWSGKEGIELVSTWTLTADEKKKLSTYWKKFEDYVAPKSNFRLSRYKLRTLKQEPGETVDSFLKKVRLLVNECKYTNPNEHIIDALIFGSSNPRVQSKLLEHDATLTIDKAIDTARTQEATSNQLQDIRGSQDTTVNALRHGGNMRELPAQDPQSSQETRCGNCGNFHDMSSQSLCPAYGTRCKACGKWNHWSNVCRSRQKTKPGSKQTKWTGQGHFKDKQHKQRQGIHALDTTETDVDIPTGATPDTPQLYFHSLCIDSLSKTDTQAVLRIQVESGQCTTSLPCKIDTGAEGNVIPVNTFKQLCPQSAFDPDGAPLGLTPSATTSTAFGGQTIALCHMFTYPITQWSFQHLPISCGEHYRANYSGPTNLQRHEPSHPKLQYHH